MMVARTRGGGQATEVIGSGAAAIVVDHPTRIAMDRQTTMTTVRTLLPDHLWPSGTGLSALEEQMIHHLGLPPNELLVEVMAPPSGRLRQYPVETWHHHR